MGWNAGGFGRMEFPSTGSVQEWRGSVRSHGEWDDWIAELRWAGEESFTVDEAITRLCGRHDPGRGTTCSIGFDGTVLDLAFDAGEDEFREYAADLAAVLRSAADHGATGEFWFLGTGGAEYDFAYRMALGQGRSTLARLGTEELDRLYRSTAYRTFQGTAVQEQPVRRNPFTGEVVASA